MAPQLTLRTYAKVQLKTPEIPAGLKGEPTIGLPALPAIISPLLRNGTPAKRKPGKS